MLIADALPFVCSPDKTAQMDWGTFSCGIGFAPIYLSCQPLLGFDFRSATQRLILAADGGDFDAWMPEGTSRNLSERSRSKGIAIEQGARRSQFWENLVTTRGLRRFGVGTRLSGLDM